MNTYTDYLSYPPLIKVYTHYNQVHVRWKFDALSCLI